MTKILIDNDVFWGRKSLHRRNLKRYERESNKVTPEAIDDYLNCLHVFDDFRIF